MASMSIAGTTRFDVRAVVTSQRRVVRHFPVSAIGYASGMKPNKASHVSSSPNNENGVANGDKESGRMMSGWHEIELAVRDYELDQYGVVNNGVYSNYCQIAHMELLKRMGVTSLGFDFGGVLALSDLSLKFISPLKSGDRFLIRVGISGMTGVRLLIQEHIIKLPDQQAILDGNATIVWLDKNHRPVRLPQEVRSKANQFVAETKLSDQD